MARLLFVHDHKFLVSAEGSVFTSGSLPRSVWARYLRHFEEVEVLARSAGYPADAQLASSEQPNVTFTFAPDIASVTRLLFRPATVMKIMHEAIGRADAVVARVPSELGFLAAHVARKLGKPCALEVDGCAWDCYVNHGSIRGKIYAPIAYLRTRRAARRAEMVAYVTSRWLQRRYPSGGYSVALSDVEVVPLDAAAEIRRGRRLSELTAGARPRLGTIASLAGRYKGVQTAIMTIRLLRERGHELHYSVLGGGDAEPWMELAAQNGVDDLVSFHGSQPAGTAVRLWLDEIDIYLQPSFHEGLPRATIEAMSRGAACVTSSCGGLPELIPAERVHRPGDSEKLAELIIGLLSSPERIAAASEADRTTAVRYGPEVLSEEETAFFGRLRHLADAPDDGRRGGVSVLVPARKTVPS